MLGDPSFNKFDQEQYRIGYQFEHRFSDDLIVRSKARFGHLDLDYRYLTFAGNPLSIFTSYPRVSRQSFESTDSFSTDNHVIAKAWTGPLHHTVLFGTDVQVFGLDSRTFAGTAPPISRIAPVYGQFVATPTTPFQSLTQDMTQVGVYLQDQIKLQNWILTLGGRFDSVEQNDPRSLDGKAAEIDRRGGHEALRTDLRVRERHRALCQLFRIVPADARGRFQFRCIQAHIVEAV